MDGLWTHSSLAPIEPDPLALGQRPGTPIAHDAAPVDEEISAALIGGDEAVAVLFVEPLDRSTRQERSTSSPSFSLRSKGAQCELPVCTQAKCDSRRGYEPRRLPR
jgi:hypothetical protein